ncbi:MAG: hypothetical protein ACPHL6_12205, partial [Rubripirellula sp.]
DFYDRVSKEAETYPEALIFSGRIAWRLARNPELEFSSANSIQTFDDGDSRRDAASYWRDEASRRLSAGLRLAGMPGKFNPKEAVVLTGSLFDARLALAQLSFLQGDYQKAVDWIGVRGGVSIADLASESKDKKGWVTESKLRQTYDLLIAAARKTGDIGETQRLLTRMSTALSATGSKVESSSMSLLMEAIQEVRGSKRVTRAQFDQIAELTDAVLKVISSIPTETLLWIGESWGQIGESAAAKDLTKLSCQRAAELYRLVMLRSDFPTSSMQSAQIRRLELLRQSNQLREGFSVLNDLLGKTPNVLALQMQASEFLQEIAEQSGLESDYLTAINGPSGFSPVWGWSRLVTSLHSIRWSENGTDVHAHQLLKAQYHLAECRYTVLVNSQTSGRNRSEIISLERSLKTIVGTLDDENDWKVHFVELLNVIGSK